MTSPSESPSRRAFLLIVWFGFALMALTIGFIGFTEAEEPPLNALYYSLQLFVLQYTPPETKALNPWLHLARWMAAILAGLAVLKAAKALFSDRFLALRLMFTRRHVILVGLGWKGRQFVRSYRKAGTRVVVIERNPNCPYVREAERLGAIVLFGDAANPDLLTRAKAHHASTLLCLADDMSNLKLAANAERLYGSARKPENPLTCHVHVGDPVIVRNLKPIELRPSGAGFRHRVLSLHEVAAPLLLARGVDFTTFDAAGSVAIVGLSPSGEALLLEAAGRWRLRRQAPTARLTVTVVDEDVRPKMLALEQRYPSLADACQWHLVDPKTDPAHLESCRFATDRPCHAAFVCLEDDEAAVRTALRLAHRCHAAGCAEFPIVLHLINNPDLHSLFDIPNMGPMVKRIRIFSLFDETCDPAYLNGVVDQIARMTHDFYLTEKLKEGKAIGDRPALHKWEDLDQKWRDSNVDQAEFLPNMLEAVGYRIGLMHDADADKFTFPPAVLEKLAVLEHERYRKKGIASDPKALLPWDALSPGNREFTIRQVAKWPAILAAVGFEIQEK